MITRRQALAVPLALGFGGGVRAQAAKPPIAIRIAMDGSDRTARYSGRTPAPPVRLTRGIANAITIENATDRARSLSLHGTRLPVLGPVEPGATENFVVTPADAGSFLYRPGPEPQRGAEILSGMVGPLIVDEPDAAPWREVLVPIWLTARDGKPIWEAVVPSPADTLVAPDERVLVRLFNLSGEGIVPLRFSTERATLLAVDGRHANDAIELADQPLFLMPGSRADVLVSLSHGTGAIAVMEPEPGGALVTFERGDAPLAAPSAPARVGSNVALPAAIDLAAAARGDLVADWMDDGFGINGLRGNYLDRKPFLTVRRGTPVVVTLVDKTGLPQTIHLGGQAARQLHGLDDGWEPYWIDTPWLLPDGGPLRLAFVPEIAGLWPIENAMLKRAEAGYVAWLEVI